MKVRACTACLLLATLCASREARAQASAPTPPGSSPLAAPSSAPLPLVLSLGHSKLDAEAVRRAVELELERPVLLAKAAPPTEEPAASSPSLLVVVHADRTVTISYHAANGVTRTRSIGLPRDDARGPELIALLSGNLSRDEAAELLAGLAAKVNAPTTDASATPPGEPAPQPEKKADPVSPPVGTPADATQKKQRPPGDLRRVPYPLLDLTLSHPIGLVPNSQRYVVNGELGLVYSYVGELEGVAVNLMVLSTKHDMHGISYATFYNHTGGVANGITGSGLVTTGGGVDGAAISGLVTVESGDVRWFTFGGLTNTYRDLRGCAASGVANVGRDLRGCGVSGIVNWARDGTGVQVSSFVNRARKLEGVQLTGITNIADEISGLQIGLVNVARDVRGMQIGVVNIAKHVEGASLGLVSVAGNGRVQPVLWTSTFMPLNAAVKFTVGSFYTQLGGGYAPGNNTYTYELGLGVHLPAGPLFIEPGVHYSEKRDTERAFSHELSDHLHYRLAVGLDLRGASPFVGIAMLQRLAHTLDAPDSSAVTAEGFAGVAFF
jgi:hypothetical protein